MTIDLAAKTVLATGANGAIGRPTTALFYRLRANLVLTDLDPTAIEIFARKAQLDALCGRQAGCPQRRGDGGGGADRG